MVVAGRKRSIAFFIALGAGIVTFSLLLYVGWVLLNWHTGILVFFGVLVLVFVISGVVLNTTFLVREIRRNEQHDAFINAVTHELKTPIASLRLYLETLQSRSVDESRRQEFYTTMLADAIARSRRLMGEDVFFLTGTDEHGQKVARAAQKAGQDTKKFADEVSSAFRKMCADLSISNDDFIRTTEPRHYTAAHEIWNRVQKAGDIYKGEYEGW